MKTTKFGQWADRAKDNTAEWWQDNKQKIGEGAKAGGQSLLDVAPQMAATLAMNPTDGATSKNQVRGATTSRALSLGGQAAAVGMAAGGPIGAAAGLVLGTGFGLAQGNGFLNDFQKKENERVKREWEMTESERKQAYFADLDSASLERMNNIIKEQNGYFT
jgi:hypothetical protein